MAPQPHRELAEARDLLDHGDAGGALKRLERAQRGYLKQRDSDGLDRVLRFAEALDPSGDESARVARENLLYALKQNLRQTSRTDAHKAARAWIDPYPDLEQPREHTAVHLSLGVKTAIAIGVALGTLVAAGFVALIVYGAIWGDPSTNDQLALRIRNAFPDKVVVKQCADADCNDEAYRKDLEPGLSTVRYLPADDLVDLFVVERSGERVGCLPVRVHDAYEQLVSKDDEATVETTQSTPCPGRTVVPRSG